jgi:NitT/TauT family transport system permease protein
MAKMTSAEVSQAQLTTDNQRPAARGRRGAAAKRSRARFLAGHVLPPLIVLAIAVGVWEFVSYVILDRSRQFLLPPLETVLHDTFAVGSNLEELASALGVTAELAFIGLAISIGAGVLIAILMQQSRFLNRSLYPYLILMQTVPILALVPLIGFYLGYAAMPRIVICVIISFFPIVSNAAFGLNQPTNPQKDLFRLHRIGRLRTLRSLALPASLPAMFTGFRISAGLSVVGEIVGGFFFQKGPTDLGILINVYVLNLDTTVLFGAVIFSAALGIFVFALFSILGTALFSRWKE